MSAIIGFGAPKSKAQLLGVLAKKVLLEYLLNVERVPIKVFKKAVADFFARANQGATIEVTKHNRPYVTILGSAAPGLRIGRNIGKVQLKGVLKRRLKISVLDLLDEDRGDR